jgi:hypothetical protein
LENEDQDWTGVGTADEIDPNKVDDNNHQQEDSHQSEDQREETETPDQNYYHIEKDQAEETETPDQNYYDIEKDQETDSSNQTNANSGTEESDPTTNDETNQEESNSEDDDLDSPWREETSITGTVDHDGAGQQDGETSPNQEEPKQKEDQPGSKKEPVEITTNITVTITEPDNNDSAGDLSEEIEEIGNKIDDEIDEHAKDSPVEKDDTDSNSTNDNHSNDDANKDSNNNNSGGINNAFASISDDAFLEALTNEIQAQILTDHQASQDLEEIIDPSVALTNELTNNTKFATLALNQVELGEEVLYREKHYYIVGAEKQAGQIILQLESLTDDQVIKVPGKEVSELHS